MSYLHISTIPPAVMSDAPMATLSVINEEICRNGI